jgi:hypothetical protein
MKANPRLSTVLGIAFVLPAISAHPAYAATLTDPCSLLTPAQVSAILGAPVAPGQPIATTGCSWSATGTKMFTTISMLDPNTFAAVKTPRAGLTKTPVTGIGDDAVYTTVGPFVTLSVKKGTTAFVLRVYGVTEQDKQMALEKSLALDIVAKL